MRSWGRTLWIVVLIVLAEELSQLFVLGCTFDLLDLAADGLGLAIGTIVVIRLRARSSVSAPTSTRAAVTGCMRA